MSHKILLRFDEEDGCLISKKYDTDSRTSSMYKYKLSIDELITLGNMARHEKLRREDVGIWRTYGVSDVVREKS